MANNCKYYKEKQQVSYDFGVTWLDTGSYRKGNLIEYQSSDCQEPHDYANDYLTFVAEESGTMIFAPASSNTIYYSTDSGNTWIQGNSVNVTSGDSVMWKGTMTPIERDPITYMIGIGAFSATCRFHAEGNPMSLLFGDNFIGQTSLVGKDYAFTALFSINSTITSAENMALPATTLAPYCYDSMFYGCTSLTTAPELHATTLADYCCEGMFGGCTSLTTIPSNYLLATTLAEGCYGGMFQGCTSLTTAPELPATTLANNCYENMFRSCTSLTTAPELPATTLASNCYSTIFMDCTSLTTAPELSATTLAPYCYATMFFGCTSLNYVKCLATDISASYCTYLWLNNVASSGTFVRDCNTNWSSGNSGIPSGWTDNCTPPTPTFDGKWLATYPSGTSSAECDASSAITKYEINASNIIAIEIGSCVTTISASTFRYCSGLTSCTIGSCVTSIGATAFEYCSGLTSIEIPDSVTSIGNNAFKYCRSLSSVTIPNSVTNIGYQAFMFCRSLTSVIIPNSITSIEQQTFEYCSGLTSVTIGSSVTSIGELAFSGCTNLGSITCNATTPPTLGSSVFDNTNDCPIYVPASSVSAYKSASGWSIYASRIQAIP